MTKHPSVYKKKKEKKKERDYKPANVLLSEM
jgi:hypothetical protein